MAKRLTRRKTVILCLAVTLIISSGLIFLASWSVPKIESRTSEYSESLKQWASTGLVPHFPSEIPSNSTNVKLSVFPGYLQGGGWIQLRLELPQDEIAQLVQTAKRLAKDSYAGGSMLTSVNSKTNGLPGTLFRTAGDPDRFDFPTNYTVYVYGTAPYQTSNWNHGQSHGVVISTERNEIIFFAENW